jgi:hypothetical protein
MCILQTFSDVVPKIFQQRLVPKMSILRPRNTDEQKLKELSTYTRYILVGSLASLKSVSR